MRTISAIRAAGATHPGRHREVNEDRYHVDAQRGLFVVVDGVGGQAAGGKAADTAVEIVRARLERETGPIACRVREAIAAANNEICRLASLRGEWAGMACVLTAVVVQDDAMVVGHVGDTRLYKIRRGSIEKITRDHSPVGEREDAGELSELEAMRNPRRNEVYRDVGSERHDPDDADFIDVLELPFEPDAALLLCSDGLSDMVPSPSIQRIVAELAGRPEAVAGALVAAANDAGGRDNVTVVYVEGDEFAEEERTAPLPRAGAMPRAEPAALHEAVPPAASPRSRAIRIVLLMLLATVLAASASRVRISWSDLGVIAWPGADLAGWTAAAAPPGTIMVGPSDTIMSAVERAAAGSEVRVEAGEYRERIRLKEGVRLTSHEPRRAIIRLPSDASEDDPAVVADGVSNAELTGFRIIGDAATPLGTGLSIRNASVRVVDIEIAGSARMAIDVSGMSNAMLAASDVHDNPGAALRVAAGARTRVVHSAFLRNGTSARAGTAILLETGAQVRFMRNVFHGIAPAAFVTLDDAGRAALARDNWFIEPAAPRDAPARPGRTR